jgi:glycogen(starch) synthase
MARVLMLSWEYPPVVVGGLGRHVHALATSLASIGHEVTVVTRHAPGAPLEELREGVRIVRAPEDPPLFPLSTPTLLAWTMAFNHTLTRAALRAAECCGYDIIHAHDWLVTHTAVTLAEHLDLPLVATIHATEAGRHQGWLPEDLNRSIHSVEFWLGHRASRVLVCSSYMKWEVTRLLDLPQEKVRVIPNGVDSRVWKATASDIEQARAKYAAKGPLVGFAGRLVYEKGVQDLVEAVPKLRAEHPELKVVIAGDGPYREELQDACRRRHVTDTVDFTGFLSERQLPAMLAATNATVVPSLYEPFGMVALEAASAGAPLAVASTGGLAEIVQPGVTGVTFPHSDPSALADAVGTLLAEPLRAKAIAKRALAMVGERYGWERIATQVADAYEEITKAEPDFRAARLTETTPPIVVPEGNLLR